jgi:alpha-amylase
MRLTLLSLIAGLGLPLSHHAQAADPAPQTLPDISTVRIHNTASALPKQWHRGGMMEIFVRSYQDSNGDGIGDIQGLISRLDYLQSLGVRGLWLMPIHPSQDNDHGYAVNDYRDIDPAYGTLADFDQLIREAHQRKIGIVIDYVINHSAATHPAFLQSASSADNPFRNWYLWETAAPKGWNIFGNNPWRAEDTGSYLAQFSPQMPDFNLKNPNVINFHLDNMRFWLNRGVDGFRFDAVAHLIENGKDAWYDQPGNPIFMQEVVKELSTHYPNRYFVCEATQNVFTYKQACGSAFAFGYQYDVVRAAQGDKKAIKKLNAFISPEKDQYGAPKTIVNDYALFVSNHDRFAGARLWDQVKGNAAQYRLAAATYLLTPGTPFIYYGEEIGQSGNATLKGDPELRTPMSWSADGKAFSAATPYRPYSSNIAKQHWQAEKDKPNGLMAYYRQLLLLRNQHIALREGKSNWLIGANNESVLTYFFQHDEQDAIVLINYSKKPLQLKLVGLPSNLTFKSVFPATDKEIYGNRMGQGSASVEAQSVSVYIWNRR